MAYSICFVLAITVAVLFWKIRVSMAPRDIKNTTAFQRAVAGISYVKAHPIILGAISLDLFAVLLGGATALLPVYAKDILEVGAFGNGLLRTAPAIGAAVTGLWLGYRPLNQKTGAWMFGCVALFGVATIVFGLSQSFIV